MPAARGWDFGVISGMGGTEILRCNLSRAADICLVASLIALAHPDPAFAQGSLASAQRPRERGFRREPNRRRASAVSCPWRTGIPLGDGGLTYGPEKIFEGFYTAHLWRGFFASFDLQHINNPGYNMARGPVIVPAVRFHLDF